MRSSDYFVRVVALPPAVKGLTVPNDDGTFSVYINALYGDDVRRRTLEHELAHLARDHFYQEAPIAVQEAEAEGKPSRRRTIRHYRSLRALEEYLRSIGALGKPLEELGTPY